MWFQNALGKRMLRIQAANMVEIDDEKEDDNELEKVNIVLMTTENSEPLK